MKVRITDLKALSQLSLVDVRGYLNAQGWIQSGRYGKVATIFSKTGLDNEQQEILLPLKEEFADFSARMADVVGTLADIENRTEVAIYRDLVKSGFDVVRFRAPDADDSGTIQFESGVALYDQARDLVAAAANAALKPKRAYRGSDPSRTKGYLDTLRLGQTEIGSYVLTVLSPVPPTLHSEQYSMFPDLESGEEPFQRTVTKKLAQALQAAKNATQEATATGRLDPFEAAVDAGVSSNLCDAIAKMVERRSGLDISLTWSLVRPSDIASQLFTFTPDNARVLAEAATLFREREPEADVTIEGFVVGLDRQPDRFEGKAKIRGFVGDRAKTLVTQFPSAEYTKVVRAHDEKLRVRVDGELVRRGQVHWLENARNLMVIEDDT